MGKLRPIESFNNQGTAGSSTNPYVNDALEMDRENQQVIFDLLGAQAPEYAAITNGAIQAIRGTILVDTEGGAASSSDTLERIDVVRSDGDVIHNGAIIAIKAFNPSRTIYVAHSTGLQTVTGETVQLVYGKTMLLQLVNGNWIQIELLNDGSSSMPSLRKIDGITIGQGPNNPYVAPANGYVGITLTNVTAAAKVGLRTYAGIGTAVTTNAAYHLWRFFVPVRKGESVYIDAEESTQLASVVGVFVYAQGS